LNFILTSYVSGLEGDADIGGAFGDQFSAGRPTYSAGLLFEYPLGNRAAQARLKKRQLELRQITNQLALTTANVRLEVETAVREIETAHREMISHSHAIVGGEAEIEYLSNRWRLLPGDQQTAGLMLDDLLNAQERLSRSEASYVSAVVGYNLAFVHWKRSTGTLFDMQAIDARCRKSVVAPLAVTSQMPKTIASQAPSVFWTGHKAKEALSLPSGQVGPQIVKPQAPSAASGSEPRTVSHESRQPLPSVVETLPPVGP
jgi:Outer membrane efflux protein